MGGSGGRTPEHRESAGSTGSAMRGFDVPRSVSATWTNGNGAFWQMESVPCLHFSLFFASSSTQMLGGGNTFLCKRACLGAPGSCWEKTVSLFSACLIN